jgi:hypothetical protein
MIRALPAWLTLLSGLALAAEWPVGLDAHDDGRTDGYALVEQYKRLAERGWIIDVIATSRPTGTDVDLPILALRSPSPGPATWIFAGIHGEEPAGPNAVGRVVDALARLGEKRPVVVIPLANPHGYMRNWRYLNLPEWSSDVEAQSVGDSSHVLPGDQADSARATAASSEEADALVRYVLKMAKTYPPVISLDLHEDNLIDEGYVYSQGTLGVEDPLAVIAVETLVDHGIPLKMSGETRFEEPISNGLIGPVADSSIDELMSAHYVVVDGVRQPGPAASTVLVFETPAAAVSMDVRVDAHAALLESLIERLIEE